MAWESRRYRYFFHDAIENRLQSVEAFPKWAWVLNNFSQAPLLRDPGRLDMRSAKIPTHDVFRRHADAPNLYGPGYAQMNDVPAPHYHPEDQEPWQQD